ncbi:hypothetical protein HYR99_26160 [Candidatus Poribacteria bacterium]|jgi:hypothetical protein|nr:hypothetical protein [Candidatus Poribacteria bacterium]
MPLIKFDDNKLAEGFYLLATNGQVGCYPGDLFVVSARLLKELDEEFKSKGITYQVLKPQDLKRQQSSQGATP